MSCHGNKWIERIQIDGAEQAAVRMGSMRQNRRHLEPQVSSVRDKSGNTRTILTRGVPVKNEQGEVTSWVGINLDIDEAANSAEPCSVDPKAKKRSR